MNKSNKKILKAHRTLKELIQKHSLLDTLTFIWSLSKHYTFNQEIDKLKFGQKTIHEFELEFLLKEAILKIKPDSIQLNTLDRPGTRTDLIPLSKVELEAIVDFWKLPNVEIIASPNKRSTIESYNGNIETAIIETIARRPCTLNDLHTFLGIHINEINKYLAGLEANDKIKTVNLKRGVFYELKHK